MDCPMSHSRPRNIRTLLLNSMDLKLGPDVFTPRQLLSLVDVCQMDPQHRRDMSANGVILMNGLRRSWDYLAMSFSKLADYLVAICSLGMFSEEAIRHTFLRFALPMTWDFAEVQFMLTIEVGYYVGV